MANRASVDSLKSMAKAEESKRDAAQGQYEKTVEAHMETRGDAQASVMRSKSLIDTFKRTPMDVSAKRRDIKKEQNSFSSTDKTIKKQLARRTVASGVVVVGLTGIAAIVWNWRQEILSLITDAFKKKEYYKLIILFVPLVVACALYWLAACFKRRDAEEWTTVIEQMQAETATICEKDLKVTELSERLQQSADELDHLTSQLSSLKGSRFRDLDSIGRKQLYTLVGNTLSLAQLLNQEV